MELLAPAGGFDQLRAAVLFGADAVYLAADRFGMRARATNFSLDDLPRAVEFAHARGVKVHLTCNVLMFEDDLAQLPDFFAIVDAAGVDALIIGDIGAFALARQYAPHVQLHVSTQASVANSAAARMWYDLGASRIVCAREMSLADIARMRREIPDDLELEVFAHGAMCMAVSGRCLISSFMADRSANRGHCTQPCRWNYTLESTDLTKGTEVSVRSDNEDELVLEEEKRPGQYFPIEQTDRGTLLMNAYDLNMLSHLGELEEAGVSSIKIEGRNKKAFYVAGVVNAYRNVLDGAVPEAFQEELLAVSHRPYGTGFFFGPAKQAVDYDGYEQTCMHVADVLSAEEAAEGRVLGGFPSSGAAEGQALGGLPSSDTGDSTPDLPVFIYARCRNRFAEGDVLEVLAPHCAPYEVRVRNLEWLPDPDPEDLGARPQPAPVPVANRSCNIYRFEAQTPSGCPHSNSPVAGSFLRTRTFRRSSRS